MDLLAHSSFRRSSNFSQCISDADDGSLDYSVDWETFSFQDEIKARNNILEEDLKGYYNLLGQSPINENAAIAETVIEQLKIDKKMYNELLKTDEDILTKHQLLLEDYKNMRLNKKKLIEKNESLEKTIMNLKKDEKTTNQSYQQTKIALQKANEMYTTCFGINVSTKALSDTTYEASLHFIEKNDIPPVKFIVDRNKRKIIDFQLNEVLSPEEEEDIRKKIEDLENMPILFYMLRDIIFKKPVS